ncbi:MAG: hypothetical protein IKZ89_00755 [Bacteroidaceae bacterium]|nr:hypothetical protein [Bacteroidaceae bacterium]
MKEKKSFLILFFVVFLNFSNHVFAQEQNFKNYTALLKDRCGIKVTFPDSLIEYDHATSVQYISFDEIQSLPLFYYGPIVKLTGNCYVVLMDVTYQKQSHYDVGQLVTNYYPDAISWMLKNCDLPWSYWFYAPPGGLLGESFESIEESFYKPLTELQRVELVKKATSKIQQYEQTIEKNGVTESSNCNVIYIVKIPNLKRINCTEESLIEKLKAVSTDCYGIEFYKRNTHMGFKILLFFNEIEKKSINEYVELVGQYVFFK